MREPETFNQLNYKQLEWIYFNKRKIALRVSTFMPAHWPKFNRDVTVIWHREPTDALGVATAYTYNEGPAGFVQIVTLKLDNFQQLHQIDDGDIVTLTIF